MPAVTVMRARDGTDDARSVPDPKYSDEVEAAMVPKGDADPEGLRAFYWEGVADFRVLIRIVPGLPKNAMGKVERRALAALYPLTG
jgi:acyl-CoA synthetase (AMP-forming)/AMP-acid ligase II